MRAVTFAAAGAAVIVSVNAASHAKHVHAKLHARDTWADWDSTSSSVEVEPVTSTKGNGGWTEPSKSSTPVAPTTTTSTHGGWPKTTTTSSESVSPSTTDSDDSWADWESSTTSSKPVDPTTTATTTSTEEGSWLDWASSSTSDKPVELTSTTSADEPWLDWTSTTSSVPSAPATSTDEKTWADWETTVPVDPVPTTTVDPDHTWGDWPEPTLTITLKSTITETIWVRPVESTDAASWEDWKAVTSVAAEPTTSAPVISVITSTIVPGWSSAGWFGPAWDVPAGECAVSIITSYGLPTWNPVPDASTTESQTWADWESTTSSVPAEETTTETSATWADWESTTSSVPAEETTTESATWADWESTTSVPAEPTSSAAESDWLDWTTSTESSAAPTGGWGDKSTASSSVVVETSHTGSWPAPTGNYAGITPNGNSWGLTYSPYTAQSGCKDAATVAKDLAIIAAKGFTTVRVYSTDCGTLENIGKSAADNGLKLIIGVWVDSEGFGAAKSQVDEIVAWAKWDIVELIVVGNEVIFNNIASASDLANFVSQSKWAFRSAGYEGPVTTTEPLTVWGDKKNSDALAPVMDVVGANLYAFFNSQISADKAGWFIQAQINELNGIFSDKSIYVLESGWPHAGEANGAAVPSPENQAVALKGIQAAVGAQVVFLSYEDEPWKEPGEFGVEPFWGCVNVF
ncbi:hypothetical protein B0A52_03355 [Exophiala mesophila]|uniref:Probable beta-glucosidase btgE n=1 Tax=Exophiala mesophila TaxID=212818 RepID=A0A438NB61_EXOME|nr:hypothetical protein B0A52_03355 [Exophiala mesophila]